MNKKQKQIFKLLTTSHKQAPSSVIVAMLKSFKVKLSVIEMYLEERDLELLLESL